MIRFTLKCRENHDFESWFASDAAFAALSAAGRLNCPLCGSAEVTKSLMAPAVRLSGEERATAPLSATQGDMEAALAEMRRQIEANSDYVGVNFVAEARKMHSGEVPERSIHGEARLHEARALIEEGVPIAPLPFIPARKTN